MARQTRLEQAEHQLKEGYKRLVEARISAGDIRNYNLFKTFPKKRGRIKTTYGYSQCLYCDPSTETGVFLLEMERSDRQRLHRHGSGEGSAGSSERIIVIQGTITVSMGDGTRHVLKRGTGKKTEIFIPAGMPHQTYWSAGTMAVVSCEAVEADDP